MRIVWSPLAVSKVTEEARYIARDRPMAADRWAERIFDAVWPLADHPQRGRVVPELGRAEVRELLHEEYRILYRIQEDRILILTVRHGRRLLDLTELESGPA